MGKALIKIDRFKPVALPLLARCHACWLINAHESRTGSITQTADDRPMKTQIFATKQQSRFLFVCTTHTDYVIRRFFQSLYGHPLGQSLHPI